MMPNAENNSSLAPLLLMLNPFALVGPDYSAFNVNGALDIYNPTTGAGDFTESYLADRADNNGDDHLGRSGDEDRFWPLWDTRKSRRWWDGEKRGHANNNGHWRIAA